MIFENSDNGRKSADPSGKADGFGTLANDAYRIIFEAIRSGALSSGQRLRFAELQRLCGTSVSPVREALVRLTAEGFTTAEDRKGFSVAPLTVEDMRDIAANRVLLEGEALRLSIEHGDVDWESQVLAAHHAMARIPRERDDIPTALREDWEQRHEAFHQALIAACGSPLLLDMCGRLFAKAGRYRRISVSILGQKRDVLTEHNKIAELAIARKSDEAVAALRRHYWLTAEAAAELFTKEA